MAVCLVSFSSFHFISSLIKGGQFDFAMNKRFWPQSDRIKEYYLQLYVSLDLFLL